MNKSALFTSLFVTSAVFAACVARGDDFGEWEWRMPLLITGYADVTLPDFPALARLPPEAAGQMLERGMDLRFAGVDGRTLDYEIDTWDPQGETLVWVRVPRLAQHTPIVAYWGNPAAWPQNPEATWANGFTGVWHFNEKGTQLKNSAGSKLHGTRLGAGGTAPGVVGNAQAWNNSWVRVPDDPALNLWDTFTVSGWFKMGDEMPRNSPWRLFGRKFKSPGWEVEKAGGSYDRINVRGTGTHTGAITMPENCTFEETPREWRQVTVQFKGPAAALFVNGLKAGETHLGNNAASDIVHDFSIGATARGEAQWRGMIDEVRLENAIRPDIWVKATYDTVAKANFIIYGAPEPNTKGRAGTVLAADKIGETSATFLAWWHDGQPATLHWGASDGGDDPAAWQHTAQPAPANTPGVLSFPLENLARNTRYFGRVRTDAGWGTGAAGFATLPAPVPVLGKIDITSTPATGTVFNVRVMRLPPNPVLTLEAGGKRQTLTPVAGRNHVTVPGLPRATPLQYKITLRGDTGAVATNASFHVAYASAWTGAAKDNVWAATNNWVRGIVPNAPGDTAVFEGMQGAYSIDGLGTLTLGGLELAGAQWRSLVIKADDATRVVFDNGENPASIIVAGGAWSSPGITAAIHLNSPARFRVETAVNHPFTLDGDITGPGSLLFEIGSASLHAPSNTTRRVNVPLVAENPRAFLIKRGPGDVVIKGNAHSVYLGQRAANPLSSIAGGGRLVLDGATLDCLNTTGNSFLFGDANNQLLLTNSASLAYNHQARLFAHAGTNSIVVHNASLTLPATGINAAGNKLLIEAGGGIATLGDLRLNGDSNLVAINGAASRLDLRGKTLHLEGNNNHLLVESGGIVTNGHISATSGNSRVTLDGGRVHVETFSLQSGGTLALRVGRAAALTVAGNAAFTPGAILAPANPSKLTGALPLLTAGRITGLPTLDPAQTPGATLALNDDKTTLLLVIP